MNHVAARRGARPPLRLARALLSSRHSVRSRTSPASRWMRQPNRPHQNPVSDSSTTRQSGLAGGSTPLLPLLSSNTAYLLSAVSRGSAKSQGGTSQPSAPPLSELRVMTTLHSREFAVASAERRAAHLAEALRQAVGTRARAGRSRMSRSPEWQAAEEGEDAVSLDTLELLLRQLLGAFTEMAAEERRRRSPVDGLERDLRHLLEELTAAATASQLAALGRGMRVTCESADGSEIPPAAGSASYDAWHPLLAAPTVKMLLKRVLHVVRLPKRVTGAALSADVVAALHGCVLRVRLPPCDEPALAEELLKLSMSCLKYAPLFELCEMYTYAEHACRPHAPPPAVANKFLAYAGMVPHSAVQTGLAVPPDQLQTLLRAVDGFMRSGRDAAYMEEGLSHVCALLAALGLDARARAIYDAVPGLRETPQSVLSVARVRGTREAVAALRRFAESRPDGWVALPPLVQQVVAEVCRDVGARGDPADVTAVYEAVIAFRNAGLNVSQCMEGVVAGVAQRIEGLPRAYGRRWVESPPPPRVVLARVLPVLRRAVDFVGDDVNCDVLMECIHAALGVRECAVPLTVGLLTALRQARSLSVRELFERADATTHYLPFLMYYALCYARDLDLRDAVEHLAACWRVSPGAVWAREGQLAAPYKLWRCAACGRANSDRFNYCSCSALRNGFLGCGRCGYAQDEREKLCRCCGAAVSASTARAAYPRKAWACGSCGANNPARQALFCFRCQKATSPIARDCLQFLDLSGKDDTEADRAAATTQQQRRQRRVGEDYLRHCGSARAMLLGVRDDGNSSSGGGKNATPRPVFRTAYAREHSLVWRCVGCGHLRSSLERACPSCPQVDCTPAALIGNASDERVCTACDYRETADPFCESCRRCGAAFPRETHLGETHHGEEEETDAETTSSAGARTAAACSSCSSPSRSPGEEALTCGKCGADVLSGSVVCRTCMTAVPGRSWFDPALTEMAARASVQALNTWWEGTLRRSAAVECLTALETAFLCFLPPSAAAAQDEVPETTVAQTAATDDEDGREQENEDALSSPETPPTSAAAPSSSPALHACRSEVVGLVSGIVAALQPLYADVPEARRAAAVMKRFLSAVDAACGVSDSVYYAAGEACPECLGSHPPSLCALGAAGERGWDCAECHTHNTNADVCRYVCRNCLSLRPEVRRLQPCECWHCAGCGRANVELESYCIHCGYRQPASPVPGSALLRPTPNSGAAPPAASAEALAEAHHIPFVPSQCAMCGLVFLEAECPLCSSHVPERQEALGVVRAVGRLHPFVQPIHASDERLPISSIVSRDASLYALEGKRVSYVAELRNGGFRVIRVRPL